MRKKIKYQINEKHILKKTLHKDRLLRKQNDRYIHFKELVTSYVELENRLKSLEESF